jgi:hypothetical protein
LGQIRAIHGTNVSNWRASSPESSRNRSDTRDYLKHELADL